MDTAAQLIFQLFCACVIDTYVHVHVYTIMHGLWIVSVYMILIMGTCTHVDVMFP